MIEKVKSKVTKWENVSKESHSILQLIRRP
jgi:hypothetical protein